MMFTILKRLMADESGVTAIEYGLIAALISVVAIASMTSIGTSVSGAFTSVSNALIAAVAAPAA
jgi:pilus assembly protein Flp/PilA